MGAELGGACLCVRKGSILYPVMMEAHHSTWGDWWPNYLNGEWEQVAMVHAFIVDHRSSSLQLGLLDLLDWWS